MCKFVGEMSEMVPISWAISWSTDMVSKHWCMSKRDRHAKYNAKMHTYDKLGVYVWDNLNKKEKHNIFNRAGILYNRMLSFVVK